MSYDGPERRVFSECPNPECRSGMNSFIEKINKTMFGPDEQSGLMKRLRQLEQCVGKKVTRTTLIGTAITVVGILVVVFVPMISGAINTMGQINERTLVFGEQVKSNKEKITVNRDYVGGIVDAVEQERIEHKGEHAQFEQRSLSKANIMKEELTALIQQSEERIKEHIDLTMKAYVRQVNGRVETGP
jgi:hypothetical protein